MYKLLSVSKLCNAVRLVFLGSEYPIPFYLLDRTCLMSELIRDSWCVCVLSLFVHSHWLPGAVFNA